MKECGRCGELVEEFYEGTSICKDCAEELQEEDEWEYNYLNDLRRTYGRDGSEDEGW